MRKEVMEEKILNQIIHFQNKGFNLPESIKILKNIYQEETGKISSGIYTIREYTTPFDKT